MRILRVEKSGFGKIVEVAARLVKEGKVIVCPTDTLYGLVADASNRKAVEKIFRIKKRENRKPLPVFVQHIKAAERIAEVNATQKKFLKSVWPGKVTVVLKKKKKTKIFGAGKNTIGLRMPKHELIQEFLKRTGCPLTGTSANLSGRPASTKIQDVINQFEGQKYRPDLVLDAGNLKKSKPSKIIDLSGKKARILRK